MLFSSCLLKEEGIRIIAKELSNLKKLEKLSISTQLIINQLTFFFLILLLLNLLLLLLLPSSPSLLKKEK